MRSIQYVAGSGTDISLNDAVLLAAARPKPARHASNSACVPLFFRHTM
jgi:hypothetical protein